MKTPLFFDYMSTTPVDPRVARIMSDMLSDRDMQANPASEHLLGWQAKEHIEMARQHVAALVGAHSNEIIFTSGATESINLAIQGLAHFYRRQGNHIITLTTEHKAVLSTCAFLEKQGYRVTYLSPQSNGLIDLDQLEDAIENETILTSICHVNNEIGVIHDIAAIGTRLRKRGVLLHVDAAQSSGKVPFHVHKDCIDLLSLSGHKLYGPKGIGALFVRHHPHKLQLTPLLYGGEQEQGIRPGTLPTHQIVGLGEACRIAKEEMPDEATRLLIWRNRLWDAIKHVGGVHLNGDKEKRVAGNLNFSIEGVMPDTLVSSLSALAVSSGAACQSKRQAASHVLAAIGRPPALAQASIRLSMGRFTTQKEVEYAEALLLKTIRVLRQAHTTMQTS